MIKNVPLLRGNNRPIEDPRSKKRQCFRKMPTGLPSVKEAKKEPQGNASLGAKTLHLLEKVAS